MDNPVFIPEEKQNSYSTSAGADNHKGRSNVPNISSSSNQRLSQYYVSPSSHHSSSSASASSYHNLIPPTPAYYYPHHQPNAVPHDQYPHYPGAPLPPSAMWHMNRYKEDELPNLASSMAAALFPRLHAAAHGHPIPAAPTRRYSVASIAPISSSSSNGSGQMQPPYVPMMANMPQQPQHQQQRRKISVTKYQDIPVHNYLQVPSFTEYGVSHHQSPPTMDYIINYDRPDAHISTLHRQQKMFTRRRSEGSIVSMPVSKDGPSRGTSRSQSPVPPKESGASSSKKDSKSQDIERGTTPDPTAVPVPAFEFNSSHLPLRPPTISVNKYSSGGSGSTSTPESQRIESRQMIRSNSSRVHSLKVPVHGKKDKDTANKPLGERKIWSITKPTKWCRHGVAKSCKNCNVKVETMSQCSSINPPPTFTAMDNYQPVRRRNKCSSCSMCSCGVICRISVILALIVMLFIAAFIVYVEMVLKHQTDNVMDKM